MGFLRKVDTVTILGAPGVGKTSIISQFLCQKLPEETSTVPCNAYQGIIKIHKSGVYLNIIDTSNYHEFPAMRELAIKHSDAFIIVSSLTDEDSFKYAGRLSEEIRSYRMNAPVVIVGNKSDLRPNIPVVEQITRDAIVTIDWECSYIEASAKNNININEIFHAIFSK